jgi:hypothetical protein
MTPLEQIATQILANNPLEVRSLTQDYLRGGALLREEPAPTSDDPRICAVAAALAELLAARTAQPAPPWANQIGRLPAPLYLARRSSDQEPKDARARRAGEPRAAAQAQRVRASGLPRDALSNRQAGRVDQRRR